MTSGIKIGGAFLAGGVVVAVTLFAVDRVAERQELLRQAEFDYRVAASLCEKDPESGAPVIEQLNRRYGGDWARPRKLEEQLASCYSEALDILASRVRQQAD